MIPQWFSAVRRNIPHGTRLPDNARIFRHRKIVRFALASAAAVSFLALFHDQPPARALVTGAVPALIATAAWKSSLPYRVRSSIAAVGLMVTAVAAVHVTGTVEAHFLFFIMVPVIALYEDWVPVAAALGTVLIHHTLLGMLAPSQRAEYALPWDNHAGQTVLHILMFLASCITSIMHWTIHERARAEERLLLDRLATMAQYDPLTGLANRALLHERLHEATLADEPILVLAVDVDGFKPVNDSYGHAAGDALLIEIARRLRLCIRNGDTAARTGGDEFTLVLPRSGRDRGSAIAQRILDAVAEPPDLAGMRLCVTASVGITAGSSRTDPHKLLDQADAAMYAAKLSGRATYAFYSEAPVAGPGSPLVVDPVNARIWAACTQDLRREIARAKQSGTLPPQTRGPESARRTLESVLAAIDTLPRHPGPAALALPDATALAEFVFHHDFVQQWAATLAKGRIIKHHMPEQAAAFWSHLRQTVMNGSTPPPLHAATLHRPIALPRSHFPAVDNPN